MPQLDLAIGFSQIFWLMVVFMFIYAIVIHYILPLYIKSFKTRKLLVELNKFKCQNWDNNFSNYKKDLNKLMESNLFTTNKFFTEKFKHLSDINSLSNFNNKDISIIYIRFLLNNTLYKNREVVDSILLSLKFKNYKK